MDLITNSLLVLEKIEEVKKGSRKLVSNYFYNEDTLGNWIRTERFFHERVGETVFFYRSDSDFLHLYYVSPSVEELGRGLTALSGRPEILVADVITKAEAKAGPMKIFQDHGFHLYSTLVRMSKLGGPPEQGARFDDDIRFAVKGDEEGINAILTGNFDRIAEQVPSVADIEREIESNNFLVCEKDGKLIGLLHYENIGMMSHLKRWFVNRDYRDQHIGSKFLKSYYFLTKKATRFILWVLKSNENAIKRYSHFGYREDGLIDTIYTNKGHMRYGK